MQAEMDVDEDDEDDDGTALFARGGLSTIASHMAIHGTAPDSGTHHLICRCLLLTLLDQLSRSIDLRPTYLYLLRIPTSICLASTTGHESWPFMPSTTAETALSTSRTLESNPPSRALQQRLGHMPIRKLSYSHLLMMLHHLLY